LVRLLFIGPPGAGKGTQAELVAKRLGVPHVSTGEMFREHVSGSTDLGKRVKVILDEGGYVPDDITVAMLKERIAEPDAEAGFILDGFPRTGPQADALDELLGEQGLDRVVLFEVDEDGLVKRLLARGRADDTDETIRNRFKIYNEQTRPLVEMYEARGILVRIDAMAPIEEVTDLIVSLLHRSEATGEEVPKPGGGWRISPEPSARATQ
jgi:adenylate kinase